MMNKNLSNRLFSITTKAVFFVSTILTLLLYGACSTCNSNKTTESSQDPSIFTYDADTKTITGFKPDLPDEDIDLVIPANINGVAIETIGERAFYNDTRIVSLRIAEGIKHIGELAFYCEYNDDKGSSSRIASELVIPNSVKTIGDSAFGYCTGFSGSLTLGNSIVTIGAGAFAGCEGFTGSLTIPKSVENIGDNAFSSCTGFTGSLTIGNSVVTIGAGAFYECSGFTGDLIIPNSAVSIAGYIRHDYGEVNGAFSGCTGFTGSLTIGTSVETIGDGAFNGCKGFTGSLIIPKSVENIGEWAFAGCTGFTGSLTIPNSLETIGEVAFGSMADIDTFIFENSTPPRSMGENIFQDIPLASLNIRVPNEEGVVEAYRLNTNLSQYSERIRVAE